MALDSSASMRIIRSVCSVAGGYLALHRGDEVEVLYAGSIENGDAGWLFGTLLRSTGEQGTQGWFPVSCLLCAAISSFRSLGPGYLALNKGDEVQVTYVGSWNNGDDGWLYGTACATGEQGWCNAAVVGVALPSRPVRLPAQVPLPPEGPCPASEALVSSPPPSPDFPPPAPIWLTPSRPSCSTSTLSRPTLSLTSYGVRFKRVSRRISRRAQKSVDARCFHDPHHGDLATHDGHHPEIIFGLASDPAFPAMLRDIRDFLRQHQERSSNDNELMLAISCRSGRHRSVAFVELLRRVLDQVGYPMHVEVEHATLYNPCNCSECSWYHEEADPPQQVADAVELAVYDWNWCCRAHIGHEE